MSKRNVVKRNQPIVQCIFCGENNPVSQEHIIPAWAFRMLDKENMFYNKYTTYSNRLPNGTQIDTQHNLQSDDATAPILCDHCNGSWSNKIQNKISPILKPIITGKWGILNKSEIARFTRWYTCYLMIREMLHDNHETHTQTVRELFRLGGKIPSTLNIWMGLATKSNIESNHFAALEHHLYLPFSIPLHLGVLNIGHMVVISYGANVPGELGSNSLEYARLCQLLRKWEFVHIQSFNNTVIKDWPKVSPKPIFFPGSTPLSDRIRDETGLPMVRWNLMNFID